MFESRTDSRCLLMMRSLENLDVVKSRSVPATTLESRMMQFLSRFDALTLRETDISRFYTTVPPKDRLSVFMHLHNFLLTQTDPQICRNIVFTASYFAKRTCLYRIAPEVSKFYVQLLLNTAGEEIRYVSDIVASLYSSLDSVRAAVNDLGIIQFIFGQEEIEPYSGLLLEIARASTLSDQDASLFGLRIVDLISSRSFVTKADAFEIIDVLLPQIDSRIFQDRIDVIETQIYSEIPRIVGSALHILIHAGVPFTDLGMLFTLIEGRDRTVAKPALDMLATFSSLFSTPDQRIQQRLFDCVDDAPYAIAVDCLNALSHFERTPEQTERLIDLFFTFAEGDSGSQFCLSRAKALLTDVAGPRVMEIVEEHTELLDTLYLSGNPDVAELARELIELIV